MNIENPNLPLVVFPEFKEIEKRNLSFSQGPYAEISLQIFAKLRSVDLCRARLVCKEWKKLIQQANLWKELHPGSCRINSPKEKQQGAEIYLGCMITGNQAEKLYLYAKEGSLKGYLYRKEKLIEVIPSNQIQGGFQGEIKTQALIRLINKIGQRSLFALYHPQATDKKVTLLPAPPMGSYLEEYALSYVEAPLPNINLFCRPNLSKALEKGLKKFGLVSLINEEGVCCPIGKTELAKAYFYAQRESYNQALWLRGEEEWFIEQGLKEFSQKVGQDWQEWLGTHSHWLIVIDGLSHISLLRKLGLIELAQKKQGKLIVTTRDKAHDSAIPQIPVNLFSSEESKNYLLQVTHYKGEDSAEEAEKIGQALGGLPSSLKKAAGWLNDNAWPLKVYFAKQAANLAEHKAYLEARSNLTPPNEYFTGREADLVALEETLTQGKPLVLAAQVGLGGVGKTQLALQYAYRTAPQYNFIWWLNGESETTLIQSYASLAEKLQIYLTEEEEKEDKALVRKVHCWLKENPGWLLIFDDAENATTLNSWLPESGGHLLITSRKPNWPNAQVFTLGVFKREESIELILKITHLEDQKEEAGKLADLLQNLPLAISQAAFYIKETHISIQEYREKFEQHYKVLWEFEVPPDIYQATVQVTWHVSMQKIRQEEAREKESNEYPSLADPLMQFCAYLSSHGIPRHLLKEWVINVYQSETPSLDINHTIDLLRRYSMVEATTEMINIHSLVQLVIRDQLKEEEQRKVCRHGAQLLGKLFKYEEIDIAKTKANLSLIKHVEKLVGHAWKLRVEEELALLLKMNIAHHYSYQGLYHVAKRNWEQCLEESKKWGKKLMVAGCINNLGHASQKLGQYEKAQAFYQQAVEIYKKDCPNEKLDLANTYNSLGSLLKDLERYEEARKKCEKAVKILITFGPTEFTLYLANTYNNLGLISKGLKDFPQAQNYYTKALDIYEENYPPGHPLLACIYNNMGHLFQELGLYPKAQELYQKTWQIEEEAYSSEHPTLSITYNNLGDIWQKLDEYKKSKKYLNKALHTEEKMDSPRPINLAIIYNTLASCARNLGEYSEATKHSKQVVQIFEGMGSFKHPILGNAYLALGNISCDLSQYKEAKENYEKALQVFIAHYSSQSHPALARVYANLGFVLKELGDYKKAQEYCEKAFKIFKEVYSTEHPNLAIVYHNLGQVFEELGRYSEAKQCYEKALCIFQIFYSPEHSLIAKICNSLGLILVKLGDYKEGKNYYEKARQIFEKIYSCEHFFLAPVYVNLGDFYLNVKEYQSAKDYYENSLRILKKNLPSDHITFGKIYISLGILFYNLCDYRLANHYYEKGLEIFKNIYSAKHPALVKIYKNMGNAFRKLGQPEAAERYLKEALLIQKRNFPKDHPVRAGIHNSLGVFFKSLKQYKKAKSHYLQALNIYEKSYSFTPLTLAGIYLDLSDTLFELKDFSKAKDYYLKAINIYEKIDPPAHLLLAHTYFNLGNTLCILKQDIKAKENYEKAVQIYENISSPTSPYYQESQSMEVLESLAKTHLNLVNVLNGWGHFAKALTHCQKAFVFLEKIHPFHPLLPNVHYSLYALSVKIKEKSRKLNSLLDRYKVKDKQQALRRAAHQGSIEDMRYLVEQEGVDINAQDKKKGLTALHWAVKQGHQQVVAWLLAHGARADIKDREGRIPDDYKVKHS